uniref:Uncharacterized protein n=5 Tax=Vibrionaceae TaxID=641 RepID=A0A0H3ZYR3_VIBSP|nr:hypothetical protein [Vibrio splendidus]AKN37300.1 hypothetical protein [Aliivibrio fischeri]AKN38765.1 hypothetical protein [Enterovibrio norvegicus]AKN39154.1 hypothetical protein [Vibrio kanaloae]AKN40760.1 hypothetical protein [Vibrio tasmaniensis]
MNSVEIVTALETSFKYKRPFQMPKMSWSQFLEVLAIMELGK